MKGNKHNNQFWVVVLLIVLAIITWGLIQGDRNSLKEKKKLSEPVKSKKTEQDRLKEINEELKRMNHNKLSIEARERKLFLWGRIGIGVLLLGFNIAHLQYNNFQFELNDMLSFNASVSLIYTFVAFIIYGSVKAFVLAIKKSVRNMVKSKVVFDVVNYKILLAEKKRIELELGQE